MNKHVYFYNADGVFVSAQVAVYKEGDAVLVAGDELEALLDSIDMIPNEYDPSKAFKEPVHLENDIICGCVYQPQDDKSLTRCEFRGVVLNQPRLVADDDLIDFADAIGKWPTDDEE